MPKNLNLEPVKLPMRLKFGEESKTEFEILESGLNVELIDGPNQEDLLKWIPAFVNATWNETANENTYNEYESMKSVVMALSRKTLPTVLENIRFTFKITGLTYIEVSHILRHRQFSLSSFCSGDVQLHDTNVMIPEAIFESDEFRERYVDLMSKCKELYVDMVNSKKISLMDARYALPVSRNQGYFVSAPLNSWLAFINQRIDRAIQPKSDNIIAYKVALLLCEQLPILSKNRVINIDSPSWFFIKQARTGHSTNLYFPEEINDKFEWHPDDFIYQCKRDELNGTNGTESFFPIMLNHFKDRIEKIKNTPSKYDDIIEEVKNM